MTRPPPASERYERAIQQKRVDALAFLDIGARGEARRVMDEVAAMTFDDVTEFERSHLSRLVDAAVAAIGHAIEPEGADHGRA